MDSMGKYEFYWSLLGDVDGGRPHLGREVDVSIYRLMQFTLRDELEKKYGAEDADRVFFQAGKSAGIHFYHNYVKPAQTLDEFVRKTQSVLRDLKIGIFRVESLREDESVVLTVDEDLDCSGLPDLDTEICVYDEGFIAGLMEGFTGLPWTAKEIDCWCTGARTCRFEARAV